MKPSDTFEGLAMMAEQSWLDTLSGTELARALRPAPAPTKARTLLPLLRPLELLRLPGRICSYALRGVVDRYGIAIDVQVVVKLGVSSPVLSAALEREGIPQAGLLRVVALSPYTCSDCGLFLRAGDDVRHRFDARFKQEMVDAALRSIEEVLPC